MSSVPYEQRKRKLDIRFNCWKCTGTEPAINVSLEARDSEILSICCPICKTPMFTVHVEVRA